MMKAFKMITVATVALCSLCAGPLTFAQTLPVPVDDDEWHIFTPVFYLWAFRMDGDVTAKGSSQDVHLSHSEVMENMDFGLQLYIEATKGNWGGYAEGSWLGFEDDAKIATVKFKNSLDITIADFGGSYRFWHRRDPMPMSLEALVGARYWNFDLEVDGKGGAAPDANAHLDLIDPVIGVRYRMAVTEKFCFGSRFDVGGFGISDKQTDFSWQAWLLAGYNVTKHFAVFGGYRALGVDKDDGSGSDEKGVDLVMHGPVIGFNFDIFSWWQDRKK